MSAGEWEDIFSDPFTFSQDVESLDGSRAYPSMQVSNNFNSTDTVASDDSDLK